MLNIKFLQIRSSWVKTLVRLSWLLTERRKKNSLIALNTKWDKGWSGQLCKKNNMKWHSVNFGCFGGNVIIEAAYKYFILPQLDLRVVKLYWHLSLVIYLLTREPKSRSVWRINIWLTGFKLFIEHYRFERAALVYLCSPYLPCKDVLMPVHHSSPQWDLQFGKQHRLMRRPWIHETSQSRCPHSVLDV